MKTLVSVGLLASVAACGHGVTPPTTPTPTSPTPNTSPCGVYISCETATYHLTGIVTDDDGRPVGAAKVSVRPFLYGVLNPPQVSTMAGTDGSYTIDFDATRYSTDVGYVYGENPDRETYEHDLLHTGQTLAQDLRLYRINRLTAGADASIVIRPGDSLCGLSDEWTCRTVRVTSPFAGKVTLTLERHGAAPPTGLETSVIGVNTSYRCCASSTVYDVGAGAEIAVDVLMPWDARDSQSFTLHTTLQPQ